MKLFIDNRTSYLNDYYFQTLCLLYFPGEKFSADDTSPNEASFLLEQQGDTFFCRTVLTDGTNTAKAEFSTAGYVPQVEFQPSDFAALALGRAYLRAGTKLFGFSLPWGYLLGLRPVKRAKFYLDKGYGRERVIDLFVKDYDVHPDKAELAVETAASETRLLQNTKPNDCGLYISIPFCPTRCEYCSFISVATTKLQNLVPSYLERLKRDIRDTCRVIREEGMRLTAVYFGGGTPSTLTEEQLEDLLSCLNEVLPREYLTEFSFEAGRPDTITKKKLEILRRYGVDRISVNPQSTDDEVLRRIGRHHTVEEFFRAADWAMRAGFRVVNADLIAGMPGDDSEIFAKSLDDVIGIGFENITVHTLSVKKSAALRFSADGKYDPKGNLARACVSYAYSRLKDCNYLPYYLYRQKNITGNAENTGYAKPGTENLYNVLMMEEYATVFSCGAGAITKLVSPDRTQIARLANAKYPFEYLDADAGIREPEIHTFFAEERRKDNG